MVRLRSSAARICDPLSVVIFGIYKKVWNALDAGAIFVPLYFTSSVSTIHALSIGTALLANCKTFSSPPVITNARCSPLVFAVRSYFFFGNNQEKVIALEVEILSNTGLFHPKNS